MNIPFDLGVLFGITLVLALLLVLLYRRKKALQDFHFGIWAEIETQPLLIAKLYSGYMGAGGDWAMWRSQLTPGPVALDRMNLSQASST